jgi:hypothetical protein
MVKLALFVIIGIVSSVVVYMRRAEAKRRLEELDSGKRCVACDGTDVETFRGNARCRRCGHVTSLAGLRAAQVSDQEIANITKLDDRRGL